jgi:uncharacterized membrane protein
MSFDSEERRQEVLEQLDSVRKSGEVNMMDAVGVQRVAHENDLHALVSFLGSNPARGSGYMQLLDEFETYLENNED